MSSPFATPRGSISGGPSALAEPTDRTPRASISGPPSPVVNESRPGQQRSASLGLPTALKPIGIINEQNTCFLNSTFQALSATAPLISLVTESGSSSLRPVPSSGLPPPVISPLRIPALQPEALEPPLYSLLPVTRAFLSSLHTAWKKKDAGGGTSGPSETRSDRCMSLRSVLREIAKKYDQYDDYRQQDAHELLRHLLDSMEMEEKDVIKKLQPPPTPGHPAAHDKKPKAITNPELAGISPLPSPLPSPAPSAPTSPTRQKNPDLVPQSGGVVQGSNGTNGQVAHHEIPENERLIPFVDVLFGGSLASIVICERCKSVSHTYEGFLDISLSLKGDDPRPRKWDRIKAFFLGGGGGSGSGSGSGSSSSKNGKSDSRKDSGNASGGAVASDGEFSDAEQHGTNVTRTQDRDRRASLDSDDRYSENGSDVKRNVSLKDRIKTKSSFTFRRKGSRPSSSSQTIPSPNAGPTLSPQHLYHSASSSNDPSPSATLVASSITSSPSGGLSGTHHGHIPHGIGPSPAQAAYIARILANGAPPADTHDPLAKLRAANSGQGLSVNDSASGSSSSSEYSLLDSLKAFTSVEVLEGENAFACKKCWRIQAGKYEPTQPALREEDEDAAGRLSSPEVLAAKRNAPPSISIVTAESDETQDANHHYADQRDTRSFGRQSSASSSSLGSKDHTKIRAPSPLRRAVPNDNEDEAQSTFSAEGADNASLVTDESFSGVSGPSLSTTTSNIEGVDADGGASAAAADSDGLSDTSSSEDEEPPSRTQVGRPKMPQRRQSTHFVMRRAFKRYLIAKEPEVLVFHLKRFRQTQKGLVFTSFYDLKKVDDFVPFPPMLDLSPFLAPNRNDYKLVPTPTGPRAPYMDWPSPDHGPEHQPVMYRLYAIVVHMGTMIGGHYIAYTLVDPEKLFEQGKEVVDAMRNMDLDNAEAAEAQGLPRTPPSQPPPQPSATSSEKDRRVWCFCSDTSIRLASVDEVLRARAYLCFYEKA